MSENKHDEQRVLKPSEVRDYEGETIDVGEEKKDNCNHERSEENYYTQSQGTFKVYQTGNSCVGILVVLLIIIIALVFFLPLGLFLLGVAVIVGLIKKILS